MRIQNKLDLKQMRTVDEAIDLTVRLIAKESRGPGDSDAAMRRLSERIHIGYWTLWGLRYREPKSVRADVLLSLRRAYRDFCERQAAALCNELRLEGLRGDDRDADLLAEAEALVAKIRERRK